MVISPLPGRLPLTPPPSPLGVSVPRLTVTVRSFAAPSSSGVSVRVAMLAEPVPPVNVSVLVADANEIPVAAASERLKSSPVLPPEKASAAVSPSPLTSARASVTVNSAVWPTAPSVAELSVTSRTTEVASSSATATSPEPAVAETV